MDIEQHDSMIDRITLTNDDKPECMVFLILFQEIMLPLIKTSMNDPEAFAAQIESAKLPDLARIISDKRCPHCSEPYPYIEKVEEDKLTIMNIKSSTRQQTILIIEAVRLLKEYMSDNGFDPDNPSDNLNGNHNDGAFRLLKWMKLNLRKDMMYLFVKLFNSNSKLNGHHLKLFDCEAFHIMIKSADAMTNDIDDQYLTLLARIDRYFKDETETA